MRFTPTSLPGACVVDVEPIEDERGFFARSWCPDEFAGQGLATDLVACNVSFNRRAGTLRGMHYQADPYGEVKVVRCTMGAIFDVIVDLRPESPTYCQWFGCELSSLNRRALYVPRGFAHGFQTLEDDSEVFYLMGAPFEPDAARGVRWDDPAFGIDWPDADERIMSERDGSYSNFVPEGRHE